MIVSTSTGLITALKAAVGGETIQLAPGNYVALSLIAPRAYSAPVTVTAADPANPPLFTAAVVLRGFINLVVTGIKFSILGNRITYAPLVRLYGGKSIAFSGCEFIGEKDAADYYGNGFQADGVDGLAFTRNKLHGLHRGVQISNGLNSTFSDNDLTDIRVDAFTMAAMQKTEISRNQIDSFHTGTEHPDAIQFHANGYPASSDLTIEDNLVVCDPANRAQGIFFTGEGSGQPVQRHQRVAIRRNKLAGTMWNGIYTHSIDGLVCEDNVALSIQAADNMVSRIDYMTATGTSARNAARQYLIPTTGIVRTSDIDAQPFAAQSDVDAMRAAWLAKFRTPLGQPETIEITLKAGQTLIVKSA